MFTTRLYKSLVVASILALTAYGCSAETLNQRSVWEDPDDHSHEGEEPGAHDSETNGGSGNSIPNTGNTGGDNTGGGTIPGGGNTGGGNTGGGNPGGGNTGGDNPGGGTPQPTAVTYTKDIAPIMAACTGCHGTKGGVTLDSKAKVQQNFPKSLSEIEKGSMPPSGGKLSADKITVLKAWQAAGFPE